MKYKIYRLQFLAAVHFGEGTLESSKETLEADTLFSALCAEAAKTGDLGILCRKAESREIRISSLYPYDGKTYYLPKPMLTSNIEKEQKKEGAERKKYKKLAYIPAHELSDYLQGEYPKSMEDFQGFGIHAVRTAVRIVEGSDAEPYRIACFTYRQNCGLYLIAAFDGNEKEGETLIEKLMENLSYTGIGGRKSTGLGRFQYQEAPLPEEIQKRLDATKGPYMTLAPALPREEEIERALQGANFLLQKRSGYVTSNDYAKEARRRKDSYLLAEGSCFQEKFRGQIAELSGAEGKHPIYRYAVPIFMGVNR